MSWDYDMKIWTESLLIYPVIFCYSESRFDYILISRAPADVPIQDVVQLQLCCIWVFLEEAVQLHHHSWGTVATLAASCGCHS